MDHPPGDNSLSSEDGAELDRAQRRAEREARRATRRREVGQRVHGIQTQGAPLAPAQPRQGAGRGYPPASGPGGESRPTKHGRRALLGLAALAFVGFVIVVGIKHLDGDDAAPAAPPKAIRTQDITIPEGYTRTQIAEVAKKAGIKGDYEKASKSAKGFDAAKYGADNPPSLEGFLFPATYEEFKNKATAEDLVADQLEAFQQELKGVDMSYARSKNLTVYDVLIIASMIEREVQVPEERAKVAAVIYNRLADGMPLGIDATIRFAVDNYTKPLSPSELAVESPYNTRTNTGLPPTPIANPGIDSIEAAGNPARADYLYYVVKPGTCGRHYFTDSYEQFQQAQAAYQAALQEQGGSPTTC